MTITTLLFTVFIQTAGIGKSLIAVPHALFACENAIIYANDDGTGIDGTGAEDWMVADSRGAVIIESEPGALTCKAHQDNVGDWEGTLKIDAKHRTFIIQLKQEKGK